MPDIQTALSNVLSQWEQDEQKQITQQQENPIKPIHRFKPTNNVSRETFNYIKNNPNKTTQEVAQALEQRGFKEGSVVSICAQLYKQGQVIKDGRTKGLVAIGSEYQPLKSKSAFKALQSKQASQDAGLAAIAPKKEASPKELPPVKERSTLVITRNWTAQGVVDNLSVMQARALYDLLKQIFGG
jgi:hypothetical protein